MRARLGLWVSMLLSIMPLCAMEPEQNIKTTEPMVTLQFPDDKTKLDKSQRANAKTISEMVYRYSRSDVIHFALINDMLEDLGTAASDTPIPIHNTQRKYFDLALSLVKICFEGNNTIPKPLHYKQRMRIREWFKGKSLDDLCDILQCLNYASGPDLLKDLILKECVAKMKKMPTLDPLLNSIFRDLVNKMRPWFVNPILQYIKGLPDIMLYKKKVEKKVSIDLTGLDINNRSKIIYSEDGTLLASFNRQTNSLSFINLASAKRYDFPNTYLGFGTVPSFDHENRYFVYLTEIPIKLYPIVSGQVIDIPHATKRPPTKEGEKEGEEIGVKVPTCCAFSSDDTQLVVGYTSGSIIAYDIENKTAFASYLANENSVKSVVYHPHDNTMIAFVAEKEIYIIYPYVDNEGEIISLFGSKKSLIPDGAKALSVAFTPDGEHIVAAYQSNDDKIYSVYYSIDENFSEKTTTTSQIKYPNIINTKIDANDQRYVINVRQAASNTVLTGTMGSSTLVVALQNVNELFLCGNLLKYIITMPWETKVRLSSLISDKWHQLTVAPIGYRQSSCFIDDGTKVCMLTRSVIGHDSVTTFQLYDDLKISFFNFLNNHQFKLQELHTLYQNYLNFAGEKNLPVRQVFETLKTGMSAEFGKEIDKCFPGDYPSLGEPVATYPKAPVTELAPIQAMFRTLFGSSQQLAQPPPFRHPVRSQRNQPAAPVVAIQQAPGVEQQPAIPALAQPQGNEQVIQPQPVVVPPPVVQQPQQQGIMSWAVSWLTAPFRYVGSLAARMWYAVFGG
jgi:WD40 repeat protein